MSQLKSSGEKKTEPPKQCKSNYQWWQPYLKVSAVTKEPSFRLLKFKRKP